MTIRSMGWLCLMGVLFAGCGGGTEYVVVGGPRVPSSAGRLTVSGADSGSEVSLELLFLPPPTSVTPGSMHYIAWALPKPPGTPRRLGEVVYEADARRGTLNDALGPQLPYTLLVTAETDALPHAPGEAHVLERRLAAQ